MNWIKTKIKNIGTWIKIRSKKFWSAIGVFVIGSVALAVLLPDDQFSTRWYIAPYDIEVRNEKITRTPAMYRYIPQVPNAEGSDWTEMEILGNHIIVKVYALESTHSIIESDPDFILFSDQQNFKDKLISLGYTDTIIEQTGYDTSLLMDLFISKGRNKFGKNEKGDGIIIKNELRPVSKSKLRKMPDEQ